MPYFLEIKVILQKKKFANKKCHFSPIHFLLRRNNLSVIIFKMIFRNDNCTTTPGFSSNSKLQNMSVARFMYISQNHCTLTNWFWLNQSFLRKKKCWFSYYINTYFCCNLLQICGEKFISAIPCQFKKLNNFSHISNSYSIWLTSKLKFEVVEVEYIGNTLSILIL